MLYRKKREKIMQEKQKKWILRIALYLIGIMVLALGITLNTKTNLGVSPIISMPYAVAQIFGYETGTADLHRTADRTAERKIPAVPVLTGCRKLSDERLYYHLRPDHPDP